MMFHLGLKKRLESEMDYHLVQKKRIVNIPYA